MKIGIFGGTFNPVHNGHLRAAEEAAEALSLDTILFIPSGTPPLKTRQIAAPGHRFAMVRIAVRKNKRFRVLDIETARPGVSFTVNTLDMLLRKYQGAEIFFILGIDAFLDMPNWWMPDKIISMVHFAVITRPGHRFVDLTASPYARLNKQSLKKLDSGEESLQSSLLVSSRQLKMLRITPLEISSTDIRQRMRQRRSIKYLLPEHVESYIISHNLYL